MEKKNIINIFGRTFFSIKIDDEKSDFINEKFIFVLFSKNNKKNLKNVKDSIKKCIYDFEKKNNFFINFKIFEKKNYDFFENEIIFFLRFFFDDEKNFEKINKILKCLNFLKDRFNIFDLEDFYQFVKKKAELLYSLNKLK